MKKIISLLMVLLISLSLAGCSSSKTEETAIKEYTAIDVVEHQSFMDENNVFNTLVQGRDIYNQFAKDAFIKSIEEGENAIFSPYSLFNVLALIANGTDNISRQQIETVMGMTSADANILMKYYDNLFKPQVLKATGMWYNSDFASLNPEFVDTVNRYYGDVVFNESFADHKEIAKEVNAFVNHYTKGGISKLISEDEISDNTVALPVSAIATGGEWNSFYDSDTFKDDFTNYDGSNVQADKMHALRSGYTTFDGHDAFSQTLENHVEFIAILPNEGEDVYDLLNNMDADIFNHEHVLYDSISSEEFIDDADLGYCRLIDIHKTLLSFPKFSYSSEFDLNDSMKALGLIELFDVEKADFSKMSDSTTYIDAIKQKANVEVNEKGAYAAAATVIQEGYGSAYDSNGPCFIYRDVYHNVDFNRPFVYAFVISGTVLFMGIVDSLEEGSGDEGREMFIIENYGATKLNRRSGEPSTDSRKDGYIYKGEQAVATETYYDGEYTWYKICLGNRFYDWVADKDGEWIRVVE